MAGVEIDVDSDEFQVWYQSFTRFPPAAISKLKIRLVILNKYFEKQRYFYAT
jgi:hypothetical protein